MDRIEITFSDNPSGLLRLGADVVSLLKGDANKVEQLCSILLASVGRTLSSPPLRQGPKGDSSLKKKSKRKPKKRSSKNVFSGDDDEKLITSQRKVVNDLSKDLEIKSLDALLTTDGEKRIVIAEKRSKAVSKLRSRSSSTIKLINKHLKVPIDELKDDRDPAEVLDIQSLLRIYNALLALVARCDDFLSRHGPLPPKIMSDLAIISAVDGLKVYLRHARNEHSGDTADSGFVLIDVNVDDGSAPIYESKDNESG